MRNSAGHARGLHRGYRIAASHDGNRAAIAGHRAGDSNCAFGEGIDFENAHRPVPHNRFGSSNFCGIQCNCFVADIHAHHFRGNILYGVNGASSGVGSQAIGDHIVHWQQHLQSARLRLLQQVSGERKLVIFHQRSAHTTSLRLHEGVGHGATQQQHVNLGHEVVDHADFVGNFGATQNRDKRTRRILQHAPQILQFFLHQQTSGRLLHKFRDAGSGGVGAMRRAESIVDVNIAERRQLPREFLVVGFFLCVKTQIFQQQALTRFQFAGHLFRFRANTVGREADIAGAAQSLIQQHAQVFGGGL